MNRKNSRLYWISFMVFVSAMSFAPSSSAAIPCTSAQLLAAKTNAQLAAYCYKQQQSVNKQKVTNVDFLKNLVQQNPSSPH